MKTRVVDSWAIVEWMRDREPAAGRIRALFEEGEIGRANLLISAINVGEVYYCLRKNHSVELAERWRESSGTLPMTVETPSLHEIWDAALLKGSYRIAYADAFAAGLALKHGCPLLTGDPEFRAVANLTLDWIDRDAI